MIRSSRKAFIVALENGKAVIDLARNRSPSLCSRTVTSPFPSLPSLLFCPTHGQRITALNSLPLPDIFLVPPPSIMNTTLSANNDEEDWERVCEPQLLHLELSFPSAPPNPDSLSLFFLFPTDRTSTSSSTSSRNLSLLSNCSGLETSSSATSSTAPSSSFLLLRRPRRGLGSRMVRKP